MARTGLGAESGPVAATGAGTIGIGKEKKRQRNRGGEDTKGQGKGRTLRQMSRRKEGQTEQKESILWLRELCVRKSGVLAGAVCSLGLCLLAVAVC